MSNLPAVLHDDLSPWGESGRHRLQGVHSAGRLPTQELCLGLEQEVPGHHGQLGQEQDGAGLEWHDVRHL